MNGKQVDKRKRNRKPSNGKGRAGAKNQKFDSKESRFDEEANKGKTEASNDPKWYGANSTLMRDAASLAFAQAAGLKMDVANASSAKDFNISGTSYVGPGIMTLAMLPLPGIIDEWSDPANIAIRDKYTFIRHANSGHSNYDAADLGMYFMVYDACCTFYAHMVRLYGVLRTIVLRNRYMPTDLVYALKGDYSDLVANMAAFRYYINSYAVRLNSLKVPSDLTFIERHMWLFSNVYADAPVDKAQLYTFTPAAFWTYVLENTDAYLAPTGMDVTWTFDMIKQFGESYLNTLLNNEDWNIMSGDILKAYGDKVYSVALIPEEYAIAPVYDPEVLLQIHNMTLNYVSDSYLATWHISENKNEQATAVGALTSGNTFAVDNVIESLQSPATQRALGNVYGVLNKVLDMPMVNPTPEHVAIATRMMTASSLNETVGMILLSTYGTEVCVDAYIYKHNGMTPTIAYFNAPYTTPVEMFNSHPLYYRVSGGTAGDALNQATLTVGDLVGDIDNFTLLSNDTLDNIHRAALLAMYGLVV